MSLSKEEHEQFFFVLEDTIRQHIPGFSVKFKDESLSQKILGLLAKPFVPQYMTGFTTTLGKTVYYTSRSRLSRTPESAWNTLSHEFVHLFDGKKHPLRFPLSYVFPQVLGVFAFAALAAIWTSLWALTALVFLIAAAPWPSRGRTQAELRGYAMDIAISYWLEGELPEWKRDWIRGVFTGWSYYRMCPDGAYIDRQIDEMLNNLSAFGVPVTEDAQPYHVVHDLLQEQGLFSPPTAATAAQGSGFSSGF